MPYLLFTKFICCLQSVATFFSQVMAAIGGNTAGPGMVFFKTFLINIRWCSVLLY